MESVTGAFARPLGWEVGEGSPRRLLVIETGEGGAALREYARDLAARMGCEVCELPWAGGENLSQFEGPCDALRRVEVILTDSCAMKKALTERTRIPVYCLIDKNPRRGGHAMKSTPETQGTRPLGRTIALGALTAAMYAAVFYKSVAVMQVFTRGGVYAALPIVTVFAFSFAHGAFASSLWSLLGIQPKTTVQVHKTVAPGVKKTKTETKRPRVHAYVNPFHNLKIK